ncbi:cadherin-like domain-containing protein [Desulfomicrobium baculatum]|uniref:Hemolysin-type calcium-binding region n=1 Tax=Desulfomicrobium baculatum (strain DSM 4028 / VKM B-1378 / X) TaxID=525897 RepID=C7LX97_DESBD|nr:cadherin-like domain-containing protein [Desulfomicrobium baculatum]ACU89968.1 Hemolysin-type calcium-binding region [Desulfomicrobium baculatum DSM 4028]
MSKTQIFVQQADGTAREVEIASGGVVLLNANEHLLIAASSDQAQVEAGAPGEVIIKLEGVGEFTVESAGEIPEQIALAPEIMGLKPLPTIVFEPTRTDLSDDAPTHEPLGVHQARVDSTAFLDRQTGDDFGMGQLLEMAEFSGMAGEGLAGRKETGDKDEDRMLDDSLDDGLSGDPGQDHLNLPPVIDLNATLLVDDDEAGNLLDHLRATDRESGPADLKYTISQGPAYGVLMIDGKEVDATRVTFTQADLDSGRVTFRFDPHAQNKVLVIDDDTFVFTVSDGVNTTGPATFHIQNTTVQVWGTDNNDGTVGDDLTKANVDFNRDGVKFHVYGFKGNDTLRGGSGADTLDGGAGQDCADYSDSDGWVKVDLTKGAMAQSGGGERNHAAGDVLKGIENLTGSNFNDVLIGDGQANILNGLVGDDTLYGGAGNDSMMGGDGNDSMMGDGGNDTLISEAGHDILYGGGGDDSLDGGDGNDTLHGGQGNNTLYGGAGNDSLSVNLSYINYRSFLDGGDGDDTLIGGFGRDTLYGGDGNDSMIAGGMYEGGHHEVMDGGAGNDTLLSDGGNDTLYGRDGNDFLDGGTNSDHLIGGDGNDTLYGGDASNIEWILFSPGYYTDWDLLDGGAGDDVLDGGRGADTLYGGDGNDSLYGGDSTPYQPYKTWLRADNDLLDGGAGNDTLDGGAGKDTLMGGEDNDSMMGGDGNDSMMGDGGNDTLISEAGHDILYGGDGDDSLDGGDGNDTLHGGQGNNTLYGGAGNDSLSVNLSYINYRSFLDGGDGDDTLIGGFGRDTLYGGDGNDSMIAGGIYDGGNNGVMDGGAGNDTLLSDGGNDTLYGRDGNDFLDGGTNSDHLIGGDGNDTLYGGDASNIEWIPGYYTDWDLLDGGAGDDVLDGGRGADTLYGGDGNDSLYGGVSTPYQPYKTWLRADNDLLDGGAGNDTLDGGVGNDTLMGGEDNDSMMGGDGNDVLMGDAGDDTLVGGVGKDTLNGGEDVNTVDYSASTKAVRIDLNQQDGKAAQSGGEAENHADGDILQNIRNVIGTAGADTLIGDSQANVLDGRDGNDIITAGAGDTVVGGAGNDVLHSSDTALDIAHSTQITGVERLDLTGSASSLTVNGDAILNNGVADPAGSGLMALVVTGDQGDAVTRVSGDGWTWTKVGQDVALGADGNTYVLYEAVKDGETVRLYVQTGLGEAEITDGVVKITGTEGPDDLTVGWNFDDPQYTFDARGLGGDDTLRGGVHADTLDGGLGTDAVDYHASATWVKVDLNLATAQVGGGDGNHALGDVLTGIENLTGSNDTTHGDVLSGNALNNELHGLAGNDTLRGGAGNDTLMGGAGADLLDGGAGSNTADYSSSTTGVYVNLDQNGAQTTGGGTSSDAWGDTLTGITTLIGGIGNDTLIGFDFGGPAAMLLGGDGDDVLHANAVTYYYIGASNTLDGGAGNDTLGGAGGRDSLIGGTGNDWLHGWTGADTLNGGDGIDTVDYADAYTWVKIDLNLTGAQGLGGRDGEGHNDALDDVLVSIENVRGSRYGDSLVGNAEDNKLEGLAGNDTLDGRSGNDTLDGATGHDTLDGGVGNDSIIGGEGNDLIIAGAGDNVDGGAGLDVLKSTDASIDLVNGIHMQNVERVDLTGASTSLTVNGDAILNNGVADPAGSGLMALVVTGDQGDAVTRVSGDGWTWTKVGQDLALGADGNTYVLYEAVKDGETVRLYVQTGLGEAEITDGVVKITGTEGPDDLTVGWNFDDPQYTFDARGLGGDDTLRGGVHADTLDGGLGTDAVDYHASATWVNVDLNLATAQIDGGTNNHAAGDVLTGIEILTGTNDTTHGDVLSGNGLNNELHGLLGDDSLYGFAGNDLLHGGAGADLLDGGTGTDMADYHDSATWVNVDLTLATAQVGGGEGNHALGDTLVSIENVTGSQYDDSITGNGWHNVLDGGDGADTLYGGGGYDTLNGGAGNDSLYGGDGAFYDNMNGGAGDDTLDGGAGHDFLLGGDGNDSLYGGERNFADTLDGGDGDDTLDGGEDRDSLLGGDGNDSLDGGYDRDTMDGGDGNDSLYGGDGAFYDNMNGGAGDDTLDGGAGEDFLLGGDGNDSLYGGERNFADTLDGGDGDDTLDGGEYRDSLLGGGGNDSLDGGYERDTMDGGDGNDSLYGGDGAFYDNMNGGAGDDTLDGGAGQDFLLGGDGNDSLYGGEMNFADTLDGGDGDDTLDGGEYRDSLLGGDGNDSLYGGNEAWNDTLDGGAGNDTLDGGEGKDSLDGGAGNDVLIGGAGADFIDGGSGVNTVDYSASTKAVRIDLNQQDGKAAQSGGEAENHADGDILQNIRNVIGTAGADTLIGDSQANVLDGRDGNDIITAGAGDTVVGGAGNDVLHSSDTALDIAHSTQITGVERLDLTGSASSLTVNGDAILNNGVADPAGSGLMALVVTGDQGDAVTRVSGDGWTWTKVGQDVALGADGNTYVLYEAVKDGETVRLYVQTGLGEAEITDGVVKITGTEGPDDLTVGWNFDDPQYTFDARGLGGDDTLRGGVHADTLDGGAGVDTVDYHASATWVNVDLNLATAQVGGGDGNHALGDVLTGIENLTGTNDTLHGDVLTGNTGNNLLSGLDGNDTINAGLGNDTLVGGAGADLLDGGAGTDMADYHDSTTWVNVDLSLATAQTGGGDGNHAQDDVLTGIENLIGTNDLAHGDVLTGNGVSNFMNGGAGNDTIYGGNARDTIYGGDGDDWIDGGVHDDSIYDDDSIYGGAGNDTIYGGSAQDTIYGGDGDDSLVGYNPDGTSDRRQDTLIGGWGNDTLDGSHELDIIFEHTVLVGGSGADRIIGNGTNTFANYQLTGHGDFDVSYQGVYLDLNIQDGVTAQTGKSGGDDATGDILTGIVHAAGSNGSDTLIGNHQANAMAGNDGNDLMIGGDGDDILYGHGGNNTLEGGLAADALLGDLGEDIASYEHAASGVNVSLEIQGRRQVGTGEENGDELYHMDGLYGSNHNDTLTGCNTQYSDSGSVHNRIQGRGGDDILAGLAGADTLDGGDGNDTADYSASTSTSWVNVDLTLATAQTDGGAGNHALGDVLTGIENLIGTNDLAHGDVLTGNDRANILSGLDGADTLIGGKGNDTLIGGAGADSLAGGLGILDMADYSASTAWVNVDLRIQDGATAQSGGGTDSAGQDNHALGDTLLGIEGVTGSNYNDVLSGNKDINLIYGLDGDDTIYGDPDNTKPKDDVAHVDTIYGGAGDDLIYGSAFEDMIYGGDGNDTISGGGDYDSILGGEGNDRLIGYYSSDKDEHQDLLIGGAGDDTLDGSRNSDTSMGILNGGMGADHIYGNGVNTMVSYERTGDGDGMEKNIHGVYLDLRIQDGIKAQTGKERVEDDATDATGDILTGIVNALGSYGHDTLIGNDQGNDMYGNGGNNLLIGGDGNDSLRGDINDDTLDGGLGADLIWGWKGDDIASYENAASGVNVDLRIQNVNGLTQQGNGEEDGDELWYMDGLYGSAFNDTLTGRDTDDPDYMSIHNLLQGRGGDDILSGLAGNDTLDGGTGNDTADYSTSGSGVHVVLTIQDGVTAQSGTGDAAGDVLIGIENVIGSSYDDTLIGDSNANVLSGLGGADSIDGGGGIDTVDYSASTAGVHIDLSRQDGLTAQSGGADGNHADGDILRNIQNVIGSSYNDTLTGDIGNNVLSGLGGADSINGGGAINTVDYSASTAGVHIDLSRQDGLTAQSGGADGNHADGDILQNIQNVIGSSYNDTLIGDGNANVLSGLGGADSIVGGDGIDTVDYRASNEAVTMDLRYGTCKGGDAEGDSLTGIENVFGSNFNDTITGSNGSNYLFGMDGNDSLAAAYGDDTLDGGAGNDTLRGARDKNLLLGGDGNDSLYGQGNNDTLDGEDGSDLLDGGTGADSLIGGDGIDTVDYRASNEAVTMDLRYGTCKGGDAEGDSLTGIENVFGSNFNDTITGSNGSNYLFGMDGNDSLAAAYGDDTLDGGAGNDTLWGAKDKNLLLGGDGDDRLYGQGNNDTLAGGAGADLLDGGTGVDTADYSANSAWVNIDMSLATAQTGGGDGNHALGDTLVSIEQIIGTNDTTHGDVLIGDGGDNLISGGAGDDTIHGGAGFDSILGGDGDDYLECYLPNSGMQEAYFSYRNKLIGGAGNDTLVGSNSDGDDILCGGMGADRIIGNGISTIASYELTGHGDFDISSQGVYLDLRIQDGLTAQTGKEHLEDADTDATGDILTGIVNAVGSYGHDTLIGNDQGNDMNGLDGNDLMIGGVGNDSLWGVNNNDTLEGGLGEDLIWGGMDYDIASYANAASGVKVDLRIQNVKGWVQQGAGEEDGDEFYYMDGLYGSAYNDTLTGRDIDQLGFMSAHNRLEGREGDDILAGLAGADILDGGDGIDTADYSLSEANVRVDLSQATAQTGGGSVMTETILDRNGDEWKIIYTGNHAAGDVLIGIENVIGSSYDDTLIGDGNANVLSGLGGADSIDGGGGIDTADYSASGAAVTMDLRYGTYKGGDAEGDSLTGIENVIGSNFNDTITGSNGSNYLYGMDGNDALAAAYGADTLDGGAGNDTLRGARDKNLLLGGDGDDRLYGQGNNDTLAGGAGADLLDGGTGVDAADFSASSAWVNIDMNLATAQTGGGDGNHALGDTLVSIEQIIGTNDTTHGDVLIGDGGDNLISGGAGDDTLDGGLGNDLLLGGEGDDLLIGGVTDTAHGGDGFDTFRLEDNIGTGSIFDLSVMNDAGRITGIERIDISGDADDANALALKASDVLDTTGGADTLWVRGDANDSVTTTDSGWQLLGVETGADGQEYNHYSGYAGSTLVNLMIESDMAQQNVVHA